MRTRTQKTKRDAEKAEESVEPVRATESAQADHAATDALLDTIETVLDEATAEEAKPDPWDLVRARLRTEEVQAALYADYLAEAFAQPEDEGFEGVPWAEIAKMPMPPPRGCELTILEPEGINWADLRDDTTCIVPGPRTRRIFVSLETWREAQFRGRPLRGLGDDGMCPICGWPLAGPGRFPCGSG